MVSFVNFARIASIWVGFHLGTLHVYFFHQDFWPNLNQARISNETCLICRYSGKFFIRCSAS